MFKGGGVYSEKEIFLGGGGIFWEGEVQSGRVTYRCLKGGIYSEREGRF